MTRQKPCTRCGQMFRKQVHISHKQFDSRLFCSRRCAGEVTAIRHAARREQTAEARA